MQKPSVGRIVHYTTTGDGHAPAGTTLAAIVTALTDGSNVWLDVRPGPHGDDPAPEGLTYPFAETPTPGHWNWPPRD